MLFLHLSIDEKEVGCIDCMAVIGDFHVFIVNNLDGDCSCEWTHDTNTYDGHGILIYVFVIILETSCIKDKMDAVYSHGDKWFCW